MHLVMIHQKNLSLQTIAAAPPAILERSTRDWVPAFLSYTAAKSTAAEGAELMSSGTTENIAEADAPQPSTSGRRNGVSAVSLVGGRCVHTCNCRQMAHKLASWIHKLTQANSSSNSLQPRHCEPKAASHFTLAGMQPLPA